MTGYDQATIDGLLSRLRALALQGRRLVAVAGPPGSGKSTLCDLLVQAMNDRQPGIAAVVPMDGFHFDDAVLRARGTLDRKGAPHTFDVGGLAAMLARLRANAEEEIAVPVFDRNLEIARAGARLIPSTTPLLLIEGNYLLLDRQPWLDLKPCFDLTIRLEVPRAELERRLLGRWLGLGLRSAEAEAKALGNDLPNADLVAASSRPADITLEQAG